MARFILLGALPLVAQLLVGCDSKPVANAAPPPPAVTVARPLQKTITEWDIFTGRFAAVRSVEVRARVSGFINSVHFKDGQIIKQGDLLFVIDPRPYRLAVEQAKAEVGRARARLDIATADVERAFPWHAARRSPSARSTRGDRPSGKRRPRSPRSRPRRNRPSSISNGPRCARRSRAASPTAASIPAI